MTDIWAPTAAWDYLLGHISRFLYIIGCFQSWLSRSLAIRCHWRVSSHSEYHSRSQQGQASNNFAASHNQRPLTFSQSSTSLIRAQHQSTCTAYVTASSIGAAVASAADDDEDDERSWQNKTFRPASDDLTRRKHDYPVFSRHVVINNVTLELCIGRHKGGCLMKCALCTAGGIKRQNNRRFVI